MKKLKAIWSPILSQTLFELDYLSNEEIEKLYKEDDRVKQLEIVNQALERGIKFRMGV